MTVPATVVFQSAKLGDVPRILADFEWAERLQAGQVSVGRVYGVSGGALAALAFGLMLAARRYPARWEKARTAGTDFAGFLRRARSREIRALNLNPKAGFYNLRPLRRWVAARLRAYAGRDDLLLSGLGVPLYLCSGDRDGTFTLFGPPDDDLQFQYHFVHIGPPRDAPILDALMAALSTLLSTEPAPVNGEWFRDCRPAIVDAGAIVADLEASDPRPILRSPPHTPLRSWTLNWFTSSFIMHSHNERNQALLATYYLDLQDRQRALEAAYRALSAELPSDAAPLEPYPLDTYPPDNCPLIGHVDLPYVGSTEAFTNMRQSVDNKAELMARFRSLLHGQLDHFAFDRPANIIYGAGGFSGILAGLVTTRAVDAGFERGGGEIRQVYGVSAGVLNGFFHAVQLAAARHPDLYTPAARNALADLEAFVAHLEPKKIARINLNPIQFWKGWANLGPLEQFLLDRLAAYTGSRYPAQVTFDDIALPMTVDASRGDGFADFLGMAGPDRRMQFGGRERSVQPAPIVRAMIAGWSMNTYITPTALGDQVYRDGGGTFYDPAVLVACLDPQLVNLLNIHLDEPDGHSYNLPPRPNLLRLLFDTHNYIFPEERRRMHLLADLLYSHYQLRGRYAALLNRLPPEGVAAHPPLPPDFRREWTIEDRSQESGVRSQKSRVRS
jgi:hypothetical protein